MRDWIANSWNSIDWGTAPELATAMATIVGFIVGLRLWNAQLRAHQQAELDRKIEERERRERHVRSVGVLARNVGGGVVQVRVSNDFPGPIQNCYVKVYGLEGQLGNPVLLGTVEEGVAEGRGSAGIDQAVTAAEVWFRDSNGLYWRKTMQGDYVQILPTAE